MKLKSVTFYILLVAISGALLLSSWRALDPRGKPVEGQMDQAGALVLSGHDLRAPDSSPEQTHAVVDGLLKITVLPDQPAPTPAERGVRILLTDSRNDLINQRAVIVEVRYQLPVNGPASGLAVSLQGIAPADWVSHEFNANAGVARFELPAQRAVDALGLRALNDKPGKFGALSISEIRIMPHNADQAP